MGLFSCETGWFGCDPDRAPDMRGEDVGLLLEMEQRILALKRRCALIEECTKLLVSGDQQWFNPLHGLDYSIGRDIERAVIAEAFKTLAQKP
jgi:hypothetical protein